LQYSGICFINSSTFSTFKKGPKGLALRSQTHIFSQFYNFHFGRFCSTFFKSGFGSPLCLRPFPKVEGFGSPLCLRPFPKVEGFAPLFLKVDLVPLFLKVDFAPLFLKVDLAPPFPKVDKGE